MRFKDLTLDEKIAKIQKAMFRAGVFCLLAPFYFVVFCVSGLILWAVLMSFFG